MKSESQRRRKTREEINAVAERYWQSGLTQKVFAEAEGICVATLAKYLRLAAGQNRRFAGPAPVDAASLAEVRRQAPGLFAAPFGNIRISFPNGTALELATSGGGDVAGLLHELFALR